MQINYKTNNLIFLGIILLTYGLLFYFLIKTELNSDFISFYASSLAHKAHTNPYQELTSSFLSHFITIPPELNPPFFLELLAPLSQLTFVNASIVWFFASLILGIAGALLSLYLSFSPIIFKKYWKLFLLAYLSFYPALMNLSFGQLGDFLLFFIALGFYFFTKKRDYAAGFLWGIIIAIKLFPALLFFFALSQKRYKLFAAMLGTAILASLIPLFTHGFEIYILYFKNLQSILWYGNSWNASIYGFLYRVFINVDSNQSTLAITIIYSIFFLALLSWYLVKINFFHKQTQSHQAFCLTLIMMLLLSPFGWLYYFSLLLMPLMFIGKELRNRDLNSLYILWFFCLFLACFPLGNLQARYMESEFYKITVFTIPFYSLILTAYLLTKGYEPRFSCHKLGQTSPRDYFLPLKIFLLLDLSTVFINLIMHFYRMKI